MSYHRSGVLPDVAAVIVPVLPQADRGDFLSLYSIIRVGEFGEAKSKRRIRYLYAHPRYLGDQLETFEMLRFKNMSSRHA